MQQLLLQLLHLFQKGQWAGLLQSPAMHIIAMIQSFKSFRRAQTLELRGKMQKFLNIMADKPSRSSKRLLC